MRYCIMITVASLVAAPVHAQEGPAVPDQFRGKWAGSQAKCKVPSESSLSIHADRVDFYESGGKVLAVQLISDLEMEVQLESSGEGQTWRSTRRFKLSEDKRSLTDVTRRDYQALRVRCQ